MRRLATFTFGLLLFASALPTEAAGDQYADLEPVSPYVRRVVRRVQAGMSAPAGAGTTSDTVLRLFWLDKITGTILGLIDTDLRIVEHEQDLRENTPCLRLDTLILEGWMERARQKKNDAIQSGQVGEAARLISMQRYLNNRYRALLQGVRDPTYVDGEEGNFYSFDPPPYWCCPAEAENDQQVASCKQVTDEDGTECRRERGSLFKRHYACVQAGCSDGGGGGGEDEGEPCPFSSDYLPPTGVGYGCDLSVLESRGSAVEGIGKEIEGLQTLMRDRDTFISSMEGAKEMVLRLEARLGGGVSDLSNFGAGASNRRTHQVFNGCLTENQELPAGIAFWERRGPFSFASNEKVLMPKLAELWYSWGLQRRPPTYLRNANEIPEGTPEREQAEAIEGGGLIWLLGARNDVQEYLRVVSLHQAEVESTQIAKTTDASQRTLQNLSALRTEVQKMALTVKSSDRGLRKFVKNYAAFLRTSCIFRPCTKQLERVLKIIFEDECFPYINGAALDENVAERCKNAAGL
ncbi:MAG TPA: hypothetical protein DDX11_00195 [Candidatus Peribacter riflensis]|uniref:Uncharacterized protein n=1 Tax=Candidatus Peribacter riflensis TaxID=1735162 RepID=A0A0S1SWC2_9BACT|nr:MAG: hypothetical protein PeribacterA2_1006 [Candidatus Peribacter riflensis]OGJ78448.1 MAG: hypothetical protein A2398_02265 [Candidatus Peribacteria bacterium RIFOXYB1_FULL_57_12]ALM11468.1 MAG: hypothetical protein PeribacterB2_1008 [Candidatus Peribacter riflensis]ALM12570.1 MAG: hypothetical protein PeribacterC2_1007 [Candidatus Peribacter riflensis]ALM13671.1 MAG: hypothetical protein PeribacterD1_1006 [Candidatus Peribacter riflensis]